MAYEQYMVYFRGKPYAAPYIQHGADVTPFIDIYEARRCADRLCAGYPNELQINVVEICGDDLVDVGLNGWNRKPFANEVAA
jgi:hypothetical protein